MVDQQNVTTIWRFKMNYCLIKNGQMIDGPRALPNSWENVSGLQFLNAEELKNLGWLPHRIEPVVEQYKVITNTVFTVGSDEVVESYTTRDMTADEISAEQSAQWHGIRVTRNQKLVESDYTQLNDAPLTDAEKLNWVTYRQALRDITKQSDPKNILWPQLPTKAIGVAIL
jgi:Phage tail assembly chaperone protein